MNLQLITPPVAEPVTLTEVKDFLKIDFAADDGLLTALIAAGRDACETYTGRRLLGQDWRWTLKDWGDGAVALPLSPVLAVTTVEVAAGGGFALVDPAAYVLDRTGFRPRLLAAEGSRLPNPDSGPEGIRITIRAGYGETAASLPVSLGQGILHWIAATYEARETMLEYDLAERLWRPYRMVKL